MSSSFFKFGFQKFRANVTPNIWCKATPNLPAFFWHGNESQWENPLDSWRPLSTAPRPETSSYFPLPSSCPLWLLLAVFPKSEGRGMGFGPESTLPPLEGDNSQHAVHTNQPLLLEGGHPSKGYCVTEMQQTESVSSTATPAKKWLRKGLAEGNKGLPRPRPPCRGGPTGALPLG